MVRDLPAWIIAKLSRDSSAGLQFEALALWLWCHRAQGLCFDFSRVTLWQWLAFLVLSALGQALNVGIYKAIGKKGVYYGFKLGEEVRCHGVHASTSTVWNRLRNACAMCMHVRM